MELDQETLRRLLDYDPETGALTWKGRPMEMFSTAAHGRTWNTRWAGKSALVTRGPHGHLYGRVLGRKHFAHRVIWKIVHGVNPVEVDHINGRPDDNRLDNLRAVDHATNGKNRRIGVNNTSGALGVRWEAGKWRATMSANGAGIHIGRFDDFDAAVTARKAAERKFGFHENHGRPQ